MKSTVVAAGIYILSCLIGGTIGNLYLFVGDSVARRVPIPNDFVAGALGFNIFSFWYAALGLFPIVLLSIVLWRWAQFGRLALLASAIVIGAVIGARLIRDNFWKNYQYLHFGAVAGAATAGVWTWLTYRNRKRTRVHAG